MCIWDQGVQVQNIEGLSFLARLCLGNPAGVSLVHLFFTPGELMVSISPPQADLRLRNVNTQNKCPCAMPPTLCIKQCSGPYAECVQMSQAHDSPLRLGNFHLALSDAIPMNPSMWLCAIHRARSSVRHPAHSLLVIGCRKSAASQTPVRRTRTVRLHRHLLNVHPTRISEVSYGVKVRRGFAPLSALSASVGLQGSQGSSVAWGTLRITSRKTLPCFLSSFTV